MSWWTTLAIRVSLIGASLWLAFMLPRWLDSEFYDQCPSVNCFALGMSVPASLLLGLGMAIALNVVFTLWTRKDHVSTTDS